MRVLFFLIIVSLIYSCGATTPKPQTERHSGIDSSVTVVEYIFNLEQNKIEPSVAWRYSTERLAPSKEDSSKNVWTADTFYKVPVLIPLIDTLTKKPLLDKATKKQIDSLVWVALPKHLLVVDYKKDLTRFFIKEKTQ